MIAIETESLAETYAFAARIGEALRGGEVLELVSDVGGGKTAFTKGLAQGLAIEDVIQSPTFTISRIYQARDGLELHHFDFYRLHEAGIVAAELAESLSQPNAIVAIEWGDIVHDVLPKQHMTVRILNRGDTARAFSFDVPDAYEYISAAIKRYTRRSAQ